MEMAMNRKLSNHWLFGWSVMTACLFSANLSTAQQTTAFTYQGQLVDGGANANGTYTIIFALYDGVSGGTQIGSAITNSPTLANGLFTVNLDFGAGAFNGSARWLDITVQSGSDSEELAPRVQVLPSPYALYATTAGTVGTGAITTAQLASNAVTSQNLAFDSNSLSRVTGGIAFTSNALIYVGGNGVWTPTLAVNGLIQATSGVMFPDGTIQVSANNPAKGITNYSNPGDYSFAVPFGVTQLYIEAWGGGGGGGGGSFQLTDEGYDASYGGGGGAGGYARGVIKVAPMTTYHIQVAAGGAGGLGGTTYVGDITSPTPGDSGGDTSFSTYSGTILFLCTGGGGGGTGYSDISNGQAGSGGNADPSAGIQVPGSSFSGFTNYDGMPGDGATGTLQAQIVIYSNPRIVTFGSGGSGGYGSDVADYPDYYYNGEPGFGGCIIIQW
jgi:hypothetical protein